MEYISRKKKKNKKLKRRKLLKEIQIIIQKILKLKLNGYYLYRKKLNQRNKLKN